MKKFLLILLVFVLSACVTAPAKTVEPPTQAPAPTAQQVQATDTPVPTAVPPTDTPAAEATTTATATEPAADTAVPAGPNSFGDLQLKNKAGVNIAATGAFSDSAFAATCATLPDAITLTVTVDNPDIYKVNYLFRMVAIDTPLITTGWSGDAKMKPMGNGKFSVDFPASQVPAKALTWKAWFDVQFIAFDNKDVTYNSAQFTKMITYTYKCS
jgi:hypothetical protein